MNWKLSSIGCVFWTDSKVVLGYIQSDSARFHRFVSNRVAFIRSHTKVDQWNYINGKDNPADLLSRGTVNVHKFMTNKLWLEGPAILTLRQIPSDIINPSIDESDNEVITMKTKFINTENPVDKLIDSTSDWNKLLYRVATMLKLKDILRKRAVSQSFSADDLFSAQLALWKYIQMKQFEDCYDTIIKNKPLPKQHILHKLSPYIDEHGLIRASGRLHNAPMTEQAKHPIIVTKTNPIVVLFLRELHHKLGHLGKETIVAKARETMWIIGINTLVKEILRKCLVCRKNTWQAIRTIDGVITSRTRDWGPTPIQSYWSGLFWSIHDNSWQR